MTALTVDVVAALTRIASRLEPHVTNRVIDEVTSTYRGRSDGTNKHDRLRDLLQNHWSTRGKAEVRQVLAALVLEGHSRTVAGRASMANSDVDAIAGELKAIGVDPQELASQKWRSAACTSDKPARGTNANSPAGPKRYENAVRHISDLLGPTVSPQERGRQLELIVVDILKSECLRPRHGISNVGEQLDIAFELDSANYIVECKWLKEPAPTREIELLMARVNSKAEGTFGVFLSMSGYPKDINAAAATGRRLNAIGVGPLHFMNVIEGRTTWAETVRQARRRASQSSHFYVEEFA